MEQLTHIHMGRYGDRNGPGCAPLQKCYRGENAGAWV